MQQLCKEGREGVKWELGLAYFKAGKMRLGLLGLEFGHWEWEMKSLKMGNGIEIMPVDFLHLLNLP